MTILLGFWTVRVIVTVPEEVETLQSHELLRPVRILEFSEFSLWARTSRGLICQMRY